MAESITYSINVSVAGGPRVSDSRSVSLEAYDKVNLMVPASTPPSGAGLEANIQPGGQGLAKLLVITASAYEDMSYRINDATTQEIQLDGPQFFSGEGGVGLLYEPPLSDASPAPPTTLFFYNAGSEDVTVEVLVARDAVVPPGP